MPTFLALAWPCESATGWCCIWWDDWRTAAWRHDTQLSVCCLGLSSDERHGMPVRLESFLWERCTMIEALISGKLHGQPTQKISKTGKPFVVAKVRAHAGEADVFVNVMPSARPLAKPCWPLARATPWRWPAASHPRPRLTARALPGQRWIWWPVKCSPPTM